MTFRVRRLDLVPDQPRDKRAAINARRHEDQYTAWLDYLTTCRDAESELTTWMTGTIGVDIQQDNELVEQTWFTLKDGDLATGRN